MFKIISGIRCVNGTRPVFIYFFMVSLHVLLIYFVTRPIPTPDVQHNRLNRFLHGVCNWYRWIGQWNIYDFTTKGIFNPFYRKNFPLKMLRRVFYSGSHPLCMWFFPIKYKICSSILQQKSVLLAIFNYIVYNIPSV